MTSTKKLTPAKRQLLVRLVERGGSMRGHQLSVPGRNLASKAQTAGLVKWERPPGLCRATNLEGWMLYITPAGRAALA